MAGLNQGIKTPLWQRTWDYQKVFVGIQKLNDRANRSQFQTSVLLDEEDRREHHVLYVAECSILTPELVNIYLIYQHR